MGTNMTDRNISMKKNVLKNAFILMDRLNLKIGEVEEKIGVSAGYLSRLSKDDNTTKISLEQVTSLAEVLGVPVDLLCSIDLSSLTPSEVIVIQFVEKLAQETIAGMRRWDREGQKKINAIRPYTDNSSSHPLYKSSEGKYVFYNSSFSEYDGTTVSGDIYNTDLGDDNYLYIAPVNYSGNFDTDYEIYICKRGIDQFGEEEWYETSPVCATSGNENGDVYGAIRKLYATIAEADRHVHFNDYVKNVIDSFLRSSAPINQSEDDIPF